MNSWVALDGGYYEDGVYYFYLTDYLGNNRVVANSSGIVIQKNHYYPFGMAFAENTTAEQGVQPYKYNGKELDQMHGLNMYDYSARFYEPSIGQFSTVDPLAEKYYGWSLYAYVMNNPLKYIDPDEMSVHLNILGYVVQENDDDDDGVYYHDDLSNWDSESTLDKKGTGIKVLDL
jgi:RHS repeat-associated protein